MEKLKPYPYYVEDPYRAPMNASKATNSAKPKETKYFTQVILSAYQKKKMRGEIL